MEKHKFERARASSAKNLRAMVALAAVFGVPAVAEPTKVYRPKTTPPRAHGPKSHKRGF